MDDTFKIFVHRLNDGQQEKIDETLSPDFLDIHEADLAFKSPVHIKGSAEAADDMLVLILEVETEAIIPCSICNKQVSTRISLTHFCHTERFSDIKGSVFNYKNLLREAILLEVPYSTECNGDCPERADLAQYFTKETGDN